MRHTVVHAGRTDKLRNNNALRTVDYEGTAVCHEREIAHIDFAFFNFARFFVEQPCSNS